MHILLLGSKIAEDTQAVRNSWIDINEDWNMADVIFFYANGQMRDADCLSKKTEYFLFWNCEVECTQFHMSWT